MSRAKKNVDEINERRMVILDHQKLKPNMPAWTYFKKHQRECGKECITVIDKPGQKEVKIWDEACAACLNRAKRAPDECAKIVKLPSNLQTDCTHRYGMNSFKLHGLPTPRVGQVLGILGCNGIGKSTALKILSGTLKPNLGKLEDPPSWTDILKYYRGSDLQNYFKAFLEDRLTVSVKPQMDNDYVKEMKGQVVGEILAKVDVHNKREALLEEMELSHLLDRQVQELSGGEIQRFAIVCACLKDANVYMFDEPSSFLDVRQRIVATRVIRRLCAEETSSENPRYVIVIEHDLAILDYMSDFIHCLYGEPGCFGVVTKRAGLRNGINNYLAGYFPAENMRFRKEALSFKVTEASASELKDMGLGGYGGEQQKGVAGRFPYPGMKKVLSSDDGKKSFTLNIEPGDFTDGEIIGMIGENGTGKTTYMEMLAGLHDKAKTDDKPKADDQNQPEYDCEPVSLLGMNVTMSLKRQNFAPKFRRYTKTTRELLERNCQAAFQDQLFRLHVMKPLSIDELMDLNVSTLSGGELQRLAITVCLGAPARVYLLDEPSAGLDCEQRVIVATVMKRWIVNHLGRTCYVIEHDTLMMSALADRMILFSGKPGVEATAHSPSDVRDGFNAFLKSLDVTFRRDPSNNRPRINKEGSVKDRQQKSTGNYYLFDANDDKDDD
jgi:ATP-binding cassette subfamily E protein 1